MAMIWTPKYNITDKLLTLKNREVYRITTKTEKSTGRSFPTKTDVIDHYYTHLG